MVTAPDTSYKVTKVIGLRDALPLVTTGPKEAGRCGFAFRLPPFALRFLPAVATTAVLQSLHARAKPKPAVYFCDSGLSQF